MVTLRFNYSEPLSSLPMHKVLLKATAVEGKCDDGIRWIYNIFGDCVDTPLKAMGFGIGLLSLMLWLIPLIPQLYENYRKKRCEGLSVFFLFFWLVGDTCNMIGAVLTHQQPLQQIIGVYYILQDIALMGQFIYYKRFYHSGLTFGNPLNRNNAMMGGIIVVPFILFSLIGFYSIPNNLVDKFLSNLFSSSILLSSLEGAPIFESYYDAAGYIIGTAAAICYFAGRIPQIFRNYYRKSCEGISLAMFYIIIAANLTYGLSVLFESTGWLYMLRHLPWLLGSLGCCVFDACVISQVYYYERKNALGVVAEREGLLEDDDGQPEIHDE